MRAVYCAIKVNGVPNVYLIVLLERMLFGIPSRILFGIPRMTGFTDQCSYETDINRMTCISARKTVQVSGCSQVFLPLSLALCNYAYNRGNAKASELLMNQQTLRAISSNHNFVLHTAARALCFDVSLQAWQKGDHSMWVKELSNGRLAVMLFNAGGTSVDITLNFKQHLGRYSNQWEREIPGADPVCVDKLKGCAGWAKSGECERNPGYMLDNCQASCPAGCPRPLGPPGPKAVALVRDAWQQEDMGPSIALYTALHVEPHEGR